jgi:outer membrane protein assembly factor BamB
MNRTFFPTRSGWCAAVAVAALVSHSAARADWTSFRNGGASQTQSALPLEWSQQQGITWQSELTGYGQSAPVIFDGRIYVTSVEGLQSETCVVECRDLATGELVWLFQRPSTAHHPSNYMNARGAPTPVVDARGVYAFFESGDFFAVDHAGELVWQRDEKELAGKLQNNHGLGASPAQDADRVFLTLEHDGPSMLLAIDKATGKTQWQVDRESTKSWSSPVGVEVAGQVQVVVSSGGTVTGYAAASGKQLWSIDGCDGNSVPSPTPVGERLLIGARLPEFAKEGSLQSNCCLDLGRIEDGRPAVVWRTSKALCEYASPVSAGGFAYYLNKAGVLCCLDMNSGEIAYRHRLAGESWATPVVAEEHVYFFSKNGNCQVIATGNQFRLVATNSLWDGENPPTPENYQEAPMGGHGAGGHGAGRPGATKPAAGGPPAGAREGAAGQGPPRAEDMVARLLASDVDGDGVLAGDEIPAMFRSSLANIDTNGDGRLDRAELEAMAKEFTARRQDAQAGARDPIVYGVATSRGMVVVRTGTRLYAIGAAAGE